MAKQKKPRPNFKIAAYTKPDRFRPGLFERPLFPNERIEIKVLESLPNIEIVDRQSLVNPINIAGVVDPAFIGNPEVLRQASLVATSALIEYEIGVRLKEVLVAEIRHDLRVRLKDYKNAIDRPTIETISEKLASRVATEVANRVYVPRILDIVGEQVTPGDLKVAVLNIRQGIRSPSGLWSKVLANTVVKSEIVDAVVDSILDSATHPEVLNGYKDATIDAYRKAISIRKSDGSSPYLEPQVTLLVANTTPAGELTFRTRELFVHGADTVDEIFSPVVYQIVPTNEQGIYEKIAESRQLAQMEFKDEYGTVLTGANVMSAYMTASRNPYEAAIRILTPIPFAGPKAKWRKELDIYTTGRGFSRQINKMVRDWIDENILVEAGLRVRATVFDTRKGEYKYKGFSIGTGWAVIGKQLAKRSSPLGALRGGFYAGVLGGVFLGPVGLGVGSVIGGGLSFIVEDRRKAYKARVYNEQGYTGLKKEVDTIISESKLDAWKGNTFKSDFGKQLKVVTVEKTESLIRRKKGKKKNAEREDYSSTPWWAIKFVGALSGSIVVATFRYVLKIPYHQTTMDWWKDFEVGGTKRGIAMQRFRLEGMFGKELIKAVPKGLIGTGLGYWITGGNVWGAVLGGGFSYGGQFINNLFRSEGFAAEGYRIVRAGGGITDAARIGSRIFNFGIRDLGVSRGLAEGVAQINILHIPVNATMVGAVIGGVFFGEPLLGAGVGFLAGYSWQFIRALYRIGGHRIFSLLSDTRSFKALFTRFPWLKNLFAGGGSASNLRTGTAGFAIGFTVSELLGLPLWFSTLVGISTGSILALSRFGWNRLISRFPWLGRFSSILGGFIRIDSFVRFIKHPGLIIKQLISDIRSIISGTKTEVATGNFTFGSWLNRVDGSLLSLIGNFFTTTLATLGITGFVRGIVVGFRTWVAGGLGTASIRSFVSQTLGGGLRGFLQFGVRNLFVILRSGLVSIASFTVATLSGATSWLYAVASSAVAGLTVGALATWGIAIFTVIVAGGAFFMVFNTITNPIAPPISRDIVLSKTLAVSGNNITGTVTVQNVSSTEIGVLSSADIFKYIPDATDCSTVAPFEIGGNYYGTIFYTPLGSTTRTQFTNLQNFPIDPASGVIISNIQAGETFNWTFDLEGFLGSSTNGSGEAGTYWNTFNLVLANGDVSRAEVFLDVNGGSSCTARFQTPCGCPSNEGDCTNIYQGCYNASGTHGGLPAVDFPWSLGTSVNTPMSGTYTRYVKTTKNCWGSSCQGYGYGVYAVVDNGTYRIIFGHLIKTSLDDVAFANCDKDPTGSFCLNPVISAGPSYIVKGDSVGDVDNTGYSEGSHLHYEIWSASTPVCPNNYQGGSLLDYSSPICQGQSP